MFSESQKGETKKTIILGWRWVVDCLVYILTHCVMASFHCATHPPKSRRTVQIIQNVNIRIL